MVIHHNHLSQESLSAADWNAATLLIREIYAHCADGTIYYGSVIDANSVNRVINNYYDYQCKAENKLFNILDSSFQMNLPAAQLAHFFRKEVINQAMRQRNFFTYDVQWGTINTMLPYSRSGTPPIPCSAGTAGQIISSHITQAASLLGPHL